MTQRVFGAEQGRQLRRHIGLRWTGERPQALVRDPERRLQRHPDPVAEKRVVWQRLAGLTEGDEVTGQVAAVDR